MVFELCAAPERVPIGKVAVAWPGAILISRGTLAMAGPLAESATVMPEAGAAWWSATVPEADDPPRTRAGFAATPASSGKRTSVLDRVSWFDATEIFSVVPSV